MGIRKWFFGTPCIGIVLWGFPAIAWAEPSSFSKQVADSVAQEDALFSRVGSGSNVLGSAQASSQSTEPQGSTINLSENDRSEQERPWFFRRLVNAYADEFKGTAPAAEELPRRALPTPWDTPPFPSSEYQGYPLLGVPNSTKEYPLMKAIYEGPCGDAIKDSRVKAYGWINASGNWSTPRTPTRPTSYWIVPNAIELDQLVFRLEREVDSVQTDHIDWGFRSTVLYGIDYRYMTAGGWFSDQLLEPQQPVRRGIPPKQYIDVYVPRICPGNDRARRPLDRLPGHRNAVRPGQLHGHPLAPVHLRHLHPDGRHGDRDAQQAVDGARRHPRGHGHGPLVPGRHSDRHVRRALGVRGQQRFRLHGV